MLQWTLGYLCRLQFCFFRSICPAVGLLGHMAVLLPVFKGIPHCSPYWLYQFLFPTPSPAFVVGRLFDDGHSGRCHHIFYNHSSLHRHVVAYNFWLKLQSKFRVTVSPPTLFSRSIWLFQFICLATEILSSVSLYVQKGPARISDWHCMKLMDLCGDYWHLNYIEFLDPWTHCVPPFC